MAYTIRDNNGNEIFSIENTAPITPEVSFESINNELKDIEEYGNKLDKSIEAFDLISNTRAMEALGYMATEGFKDNIKKVGHTVWEKIKKICEKIVSAIKDALNFIKNLVVKIKNNALKQYAKIGARIMASSLINYKRYNQSLNTVSKDNSKNSIVNLIESDRMTTFVIAYKNFKNIIKINNKLNAIFKKLTKDKSDEESFNALTDKVDDIYSDELKSLDAIDIDRLEESVSYNEKVSIALKFFKDIETGKYDTVFLPYASKTIDSLTKAEKEMEDFISKYSEYIKDNDKVNKAITFISKEIKIYPKVIQILLKFISVSSDMYNIAIAAGKKENNKSE